MLLEKLEEKKREMKKKTEENKGKKLESGRKEEKKGRGERRRKRRNIKHVWWARTSAIGKWVVVSVFKGCDHQSTKKNTTKDFSSSPK